MAILSIIFLFSQTPNKFWGIKFFVFYNLVFLEELAA